MGLGNSYFHKGSIFLADAEKAYLKAVETKPNAYLALEGLGNIRLRQRNRDEEALAYFERALNHNKTAAHSAAGAGQALLRLRRNEEAQAAFEAALSLRPKLGYVWAGLATAQHRQKAWGDAARSYAKAFEINPRARYFLNDWKTALRNWAKTEPANPEPHLRLGSMYLSEDDFEDALAAFKAALARAPTEGQAEHVKARSEIAALERLFAIREPLP